MTKYGSADVGFLVVDGYDVLGQATQLEDTEEALIEETTTLGKSWAENASIGVKRYTLQEQGFFDHLVNPAFVAVSGTHLLFFGPEGNAVGKRFVGAQEVQADYRRQIARGALHKASAKYETYSSKDDGKVVHPLGAETAASGQNGVVDNGGTTTNGGTGYLAVTDLTLGGYTSVTIKLRHSVDNITYADLIAFANVTGTPNAQRLTAAGTVNRYVSQSWLFNGAGAGESVSYVVGFARNP